jgi:RNase P subunit RPR2
MIVRRSGALLCIVACIYAVGCGRPEPHLDDGDGMPAPPIAVPLPDEPGILATVVSEPVHERFGPGGAPFEVALRTHTRGAGHPRRFGTLTLETAFRRAPLETYPCTSCHIPGRPGVAGDERLEDAHGNIQPVHPAEVGATCTTCHVPARVDELALATGQIATLDQPYRLCAQCHAPEVSAWAGGAHGKRLDGWHGRRVVMNCTDCHDPHRPSIDQRVPFRGPTLPGSGER